eukprot:4408987-Pleurochrysis_carterae.AAC.3
MHLGSSALLSASHSRNRHLCCCSTPRPTQRHKSMLLFIFTSFEGRFAATRVLRACSQCGRACSASFARSASRCARPSAFDETVGAVQRESARHVLMHPPLVHLPYALLYSVCAVFLELRLPYALLYSVCA